MGSSLAFPTYNFFKTHRLAFGFAMSATRAQRGRKQNSQRGRDANRGRGSGGRGSARQPQQAERKTTPSSARGKHLDYLPSISRSGGDNGEGDTLKNKGIQNDYWDMIQSKLDAHWKDYPATAPESAQRSERETNLLLHLRKLREGIMASKREDIFALSVYETSFYSAIAFQSSSQASNVFSHLLELYASLLSTSSPEDAEALRRRATALTIVALFLFLKEAYPSQMLFYERLGALHTLKLNKTDEALEWVSDVRKSIAIRNFVECERLTRQARISSIIERIIPNEGRNLPEVALLTVAIALRAKLRETSWLAMRVAYRELSLQPGTTTAEWLTRHLLLDDSSGQGDVAHEAEEWMKKRVEDGHAAVKDGIDKRWMLRKPV